MTQLVEYALVMLISTLFAGASAATYASYKNLEGNVEFAATFSGVSALAEQALQYGSSQERMLLPTSVISCSEGILSFSSAGRTATASLPAGCNFLTNVPGGIHSVEFLFRSSMLTLGVA